jgi:DNA-binding response OmpR family regulator
MVADSHLKILLVEDEALLALQLEDDLTDAGHTIVGTAIRSAEAVELARKLDPDLVLLDVHLADGPTGVDISRQIAANGAVVVFMTANLKRIPDDFAGASGVIPKPYTLNGLRTAITYLASAINDEAVPPPPRSLELAPRFAPAQPLRLGKHLPL